MVVSPEIPPDPAKHYGYESVRLDRGDEWRGCNHCGRTVPADSHHWITVIPWERNLLLHAWCHMKMYRRDYAMVLYGRDIFSE